MRGSRLKFELRHRNRSFIHASCFILRLTVHWTPAEVLSHLLLSCISVVFFSEPEPVVHASLVKIHGRMALLRNTPPPQVMCPRGSGSNDILVNPQNQNWRSGWYGGNRSNRCPTAIHSTYDFGSKTNNYLWCWLHQCIFRNERKMKDKHELITLNEKALLQVFLGIQKFRWNLMHCFHAKVNLFRTLVKGLLFYQTRSHAIVLNDTLQKRTRNAVNRMYANDGSSTSPAQEGSHTLTDILESPGQALHFSRICARGFDGSLSRRLRGAGPVLPDPLLQQQRCFQSWLWWRVRKCNWRRTCGTARLIRAGRSRARKGGRDLSFDDLEEVLKSRIAVCKNTWRIHQNTFYWCSLKLAQKKRIAVLSNTIPRYRSLQITSRDLFWESGKYGDWRGFIQQNLPITKVTASRGHSIFGTWGSF